MSGRCFLERSTSDLMLIRAGKTGHRKRYYNEMVQAFGERLMQMMVVMQHAEYVTLRLVLIDLSVRAPLFASYASTDLARPRL